MSDDTTQLDLFPDIPRIERPFRQKLLKRPQHPVWTDHKAHLIERYLYYFVLVTRHGTYIDGFAGPQDPDKPETWAAKLVLDTEPPWLRNFFLCEKSPQQFRRLEELKDAHPGRHIELYNKDFNLAVSSILGSGRITPSEATFCLLDQRTFECKWSTLQALAGFKKTGYKIELFYFLAHSWLNRAIAATKDPTPIRDWWGKDSWQSDLENKASEIDQAFCERVQSELGYKSALPWPIYQRQDGGPVMYSMIHATDHPEAPVLMDRAYRNVVTDKEPIEQLELEFKQWRQES